MVNEENEFSIEFIFSVSLINNEHCVTFLTRAHRRMVIVV